MYSIYGSFSMYFRLYEVASLLATHKGMPYSNVLIFEHINTSEYSLIHTRIDINLYPSDIFNVYFKIYLIFATNQNTHSQHNYISFRIFIKV